MRRTFKNSYLLDSQSLFKIDGSLDTLLWPNFKELLQLAKNLEKNNEIKLNVIIQVNTIAGNIFICFEQECCQGFNFDQYEKNLHFSDWLYHSVLHLLFKGLLTLADVHLCLEFLETQNKALSNQITFSYHNSDTFTPETAEDIYKKLLGTNQPQYAYTLRDVLSTFALEKILHAYEKNTKDMQTEKLALLLIKLMLTSPEYFFSALKGLTDQQQNKLKVLKINSLNKPVKNHEIPNRFLSIIIFESFHFIINLHDKNKHFIEDITARIQQKNLSLLAKSVHGDNYRILNSLIVIMVLYPAHFSSYIRELDLKIIGKLKNPKLIDINSEIPEKILAEVKTRIEFCCQEDKNQRAQDIHSQAMGHTSLPKQEQHTNKFAFIKKFSFHNSRQKESSNSEKTLLPSKKNP